MVESAHALGRLPLTPERRVLVLGAMRRTAAALERAGWSVDLRPAPTLAAGVLAHAGDHRPARIVVAHPASRSGLALVGRLARALPVPVEVREPVGFLTRPGDLTALAGPRPRMDRFYREVRSALGLLLDAGGGPVGGRWSFDAENRRPPPRRPLLDVPAPWLPDPADPLDAAIRRETAALPALGPGGERVMAATPVEARAALERFLTHRLAAFGPFEDAMLTEDWAMSHSLLSGPLNLGLLPPRAVAEAGAAALASGAPVASVEGFVRQVVGWREYVWGWYWHRPWRRANRLEADGPVPAALWGAPTRMRCVGAAMDGVRRRGYAHHIQRLMVLGNLMLLAGTAPWAATRWFWAAFVDASAWVMAPNVVGMALWADAPGPGMTTKPYAASGAYIRRMSDHCTGCAYDPRQATGPRACPFTSLYWDFLARHRTLLGANPRMALALRNLDRRDDLAAVRAQAAATRDALAAGGA